MLVIGGDSLIDFIQSGVTNGLPVHTGFPGGSAYNVACALGKQGRAPGWLGPFGTDPMGQLLAGHLERSGANRLMTASTKPTTLAVVSTTDGQAAYQFYREGTADRDVSLDSLRAALPENMSAFHVGSLALTDGPDADAWTDLYCSANVPTTLDPNIRAAFIHDRDTYSARYERLIAATTLLKLSDEDCAWFAPNATPEQVATEMLSRSSANVAVLTMGGDGAVAFSKSGHRVAVPVAQVSELADTVGAGDTFMASLISKLSEDGRLNTAALADITEDALEETLRYATTAAAINCERHGCQPPTRAEIDARL